MMESINSAPEYSFEFDGAGQPIAGFAINSSIKNSEVDVAIRAFFYDTNGDPFFQCLDNISTLYLNQWLIQNNKKISNIDNCLIQISPENRVFVDINCRVIVSAVSKERIDSGDPVAREQLADIQRVKILNVLIRKNCGKIFIFSRHWRRGVYFDLSPVMPDAGIPTDNFETSLATCYSILLHPEIADLYPKVKEKLFDRGWFPFIQILGDPFYTFLNIIKDGLDPTTIELELIDSFDEDKIFKIFNTWMSNPIFKENEAILRRGIEMYLQGDYICSGHILFLRIEGILRNLYLKNSEKKPHTHDLRKNLISELSNKYSSNNLFLPDDFDEYLEKVYFKGFDLSKNQVDTSRVSIAHGVLKPEFFTKVSVFQSFLILDQIFYYT